MRVPVCPVCVQVFADGKAGPEDILGATPSAVNQLLAEIQGLSQRVMEIEKRTRK